MITIKYKFDFKIDTDSLNENKISIPKLPDPNESIDIFIKDLQEFVSKERSSSETFKAFYISLFSFINSLTNKMHERLKIWKNNMTDKTCDQYCDMLKSIEKLIDFIIDAKSPTNYILEKERCVYSALYSYYDILKLIMKNRLSEHKFSEFKKLINIEKSLTRPFTINLLTCNKVMFNKKHSLYFYSQTPLSKRETDNMPEFDNIFNELNDNLYSEAMRIFNKFYFGSLDDKIKNIIIQAKEAHKNELIKGFTLSMIAMHNDSYDLNINNPIFTKEYFQFIDLFASFKKLFNQTNLFFDSERFKKSSILNNDDTVVCFREASNSMDSIYATFLNLNESYFAPDLYKYLDLKREHIDNCFENTILINHLKKNGVFKNNFILNSYELYPHSTPIAFMSYIIENPYYLNNEKGLFELYLSLLNKRVNLDETTINYAIQLFNDIYNMAIESIKESTTPDEQIKLINAVQIALMRLSIDYKIPLENIRKITNSLFDKLRNNSTDYDEMTKLYLICVKNISLLEKYFLINEIHNLFYQFYYKCSSIISSKAIYINSELNLDSNIHIDELNSNSNYKYVINAINGYDANIKETIYDNYPYSTNKSDILKYLSLIKSNNENKVYSEKCISENLNF